MGRDDISRRCELTDCKIRPRVPPFKSLKDIGTDTNLSATYDFLLVFHSNYGPISYRFRDKGRYLQKNFPPQVYYTPGEGFP